VVAEKFYRKQKQSKVTNPRQWQKVERATKRIETIKKLETENETHKNGRRQNLDKIRALCDETNTNNYILYFKLLKYL
jgi:hypothetical protein